MEKITYIERKVYSEILKKRVNGLKDGYRQNIAFIGDELVGKTALIFNFLDKFYDNRIITLYLEMRLEPLNSFAKRFIGVLLYNFIAKSEIPLKEDIDFLINKSEKYIPKTAERIRAILDAVSRKKRNDVFADLLSLCELIHEETGKFCVVILDEFQYLQNLGIKNLYREWSKILILQKNTLYIITSSFKYKAKIILSKNLSLLFGNFETILLEPFDTKESQEFIAANSGGLMLNAGVKNFIIDFCGGLPFYLEVITDSLLKSPQVNLNDTIENMLFAPSGILNQRFSNYIKRFLDDRHNQEYMSILYLISTGCNKLKDIAHVLRKQKKELVLRINHLLELDTVARSGDFLKINDRVFNFWLKFVYQEKMQSLTFDFKSQRELFRKNIDNIINEFLLNTQKPIAERLTELMHLFEDEMVQIEDKRIRLNHFKEIKPLEFENKKLKDGLIGRSSDSLWLVGLKYGPLTEEDIAEFAKECKKYRHKLQRKIIITSHGVDMNARLRALDEKIWTWDYEKLNQIMELFYRQRVLV